MLHYFKFRQDLFDPQPAKDIYVKRGPGKGWPEECPPLRAANGFGFDLLANFDLTFIRKRGGGWKVENDVVVESDFNWSPDSADDKTEAEAGPHDPAGQSSPDREELADDIGGLDNAGDGTNPGQPLTQQYAWFWEKGQTLPHVISDNVYAEIDNQCKVSTFLYLQTDPNEILLMGDIPNVHRPWRAMSALVETDWYPASYPWHTVLELDRREKRIEIKQGEPICRVTPVRRDTYFAQQMSPGGFDEFFSRGQNWLATHGKPGDGGSLDITRTYVRQQARPRFIVMR